MSAIYRNGIWYGVNAGSGDTIQVQSLPEAVSDLVGVIYQYVGVTGQDYTHGYFYECVEDSSVTPHTYSWRNVSVQSGGSGDTFQVTVPSSGWVSHDTYFTVDISVYGITSDVSLVLDVVPDLNNYTVDLEQWGKLIKAETGDGVITLYTKEAFSSPVTMLVKSI